MLTETPNPRTANIDQLPTLEILQVMNDEDASVAVAVRRVLPAVARAVDTITDHLRAGGRLLYVGAGTSGRLGVLDAGECIPTFSTDPTTVQGILAGGAQALTERWKGRRRLRRGVSHPDRLGVGEHDVVVGSQPAGGTLCDRRAPGARERGAATVAVTCNEPAPMLELADIPIPVVVGPEIIAGSTRLKAGTAQKMILNMLSTVSMIRLGKVYGNLMVDLKVTNEKLVQRARGIVSKVAGVSEDEAAHLLAQTHNEVKPAIVMALLGVTPEEARARLDAAGGMLRQVIGDRLAR
jgi:N-acetylmuramic acid 6-phosphate etherase